MSLFSIFRKNKQEAGPGDSEFTSRAADESQAAARSRGRRKASQSEEPADPILPEKKRARRRLVGAIALVLAAVIGLPMLLDSEPKPLAEDIAIQIPVKDKPASATVQHKAAAPSLPASATLDPSEQVVEPAPAIAEDKAATMTKVAQKPEEVVKAPVPKPEARQEQLKPEQKKPEKAETRTAVEKPVADKKDDSARALALLEGKGDAGAKAASEKKSHGENGSGKYAVQVAALATQEKINELRGKLNAAGIQSYTQKVATESGERIRIRVGPFATREEAEKMRGKLIKMGLNGTLVPPPKS